MTKKKVKKALKQQRSRSLTPQLQTMKDADVEECHNYIYKFTFSAFINKALYWNQFVFYFLVVTLSAALVF